MKIIQLLPELKVGGVERGTVDLSDHLIKLGHDSAVVSAGGQLVKLLDDHGAKHFQLPIAKKNIFRVPAGHSSCSIKVSSMDKLFCLKEFSG